MKIVTSLLLLIGIYCLGMAIESKQLEATFIYGLLALLVFVVTTFAGKEALKRMK